MKKIALLLIAVLSFAAADRAMAQSPAPSGTTLITLGTAGGPLPRKDRAQSSNLLAVNGTLYLIDAGDGATRRIVQAGMEARGKGCRAQSFISRASGAFHTSQGRGQPVQR